MIEGSIMRFKSNFREALIANIHKSYGSMEEFADEKGYRLEDLAAMMDGKFTTIDEFLKLMLDTNWTISFKDHFDHSFRFPDSFTVPSVSDIQMNNFT